MNKRMTKYAAVAALMALPVMSAQAGAGSNNHAAVFLGVTKTSSATDPTVGIEYEYRTPLWDKRIGIGLVGERIFGDKYDANLFVAGVVVHPWKDSKANLSVGKESVGGKSKNVLRVGVGYDFHYNSISYGPVYNLDRISYDGKTSTSHVIGIAVGMGF